MYLYCNVCGMTSKVDHVEEGSEPSCVTCGTRTQILYSHSEEPPSRPASEFFDEYDLWLEKRFGVPVSDPDTTTDDPADRSSWSD